MTSAHDINKSSLKAVNQNDSSTPPDAILDLISPLGSDAQEETDDRDPTLPDSPESSDWGEHVENHTEPSVVASVEYVHGRRRAVLSLDQLSIFRRDSSRLIWTGLHNPKPDEVIKACTKLGIGQEAMEDVLAKHRKPKMIEYGNFVHIVAITITRCNKKIQYGEMQLLFGPGFVLTVRRGEAVKNTKLRNRLESCPELIARGSDFVIAEILDVIADSYLTLATRLDNEVEMTEHEMMLENSLAEEDIRRLYKQRRELLRIRTCIWPMVGICYKLSIIKLSFVDADSRAYFTLVSDRIARIDDQINALREALAFAFEASMMIGQSQQTEITKKLAAWAAILAVPTAIAGIYGMNFRFMPELNWWFSYPLIMFVMIGICSTLFWRFKKSGWL